MGLKDHFVGTLSISKQALQQPEAKMISGQAERLKSGRPESYRDVFLSFGKKEKLLIKLSAKRKSLILEGFSGTHRGVMSTRYDDITP